MSDLDEFLEPADLTNGIDEEPTIISSPRARAKKLPSRGKIAVDMDDVLCQTNRTIVDMHNELFGASPPVVFEDFQNYLYWLNRGWGDPHRTVDMVHKVYEAGLAMRTPPIPGAKEGLLRLKELGFDLIIITARSEKMREGTEDWIAKYMPDIFDELHFTGAFAHLEPTKEEKEGHAAAKAVVSHHKRAKAEVIHQTHASLLIDDSSENAYESSIASPPVRVLLFGDYPWNAIVHRPELLTEQDKLTYVEKEQRGLLDAAAERRKQQIEEGWLPHGTERVRDWEDVVSWVQKHGAELVPGVPGFVL